MNETPPAPYVWLAPTEDAAFAPAAPSAADDARVAAWAAVRRAKLVRPERPTELAVADGSIANEIEADLVRAKEALTALDVGALEAALGRAEAAVKSHPTLLQGAWLRAEIERTWANRWSRAEPRDEARATRAWKRAAALDGGRVAGIGESALGQADVAPVAVPLATREGFETTIDGRRIATATVSLGEGEHLVTVRKGGRLVFAEWREVARGKPLTLPSLDEAPCTEGDFAAVRARGDLVSAPSTQCKVWFAVRARSAGLPESIAQCRGARCGRFVVLDDPRTSKVPAAPQPAPEERRAPAWITWTAIGAGVLLGGGALLLSSGAFDKPARDSRFVTGGLRVE